MYVCCVSDEACGGWNVALIECPSWLSIYNCSTSLMYTCGHNCSLSVPLQWIRKKEQNRHFQHIMYCRIDMNVTAGHHTMLLSGNNYVSGLHSQQWATNRKKGKLRTLPHSVPLPLLHTLTSCSAFPPPLSTSLFFHLCPPLSSSRAGHVRMYVWV